MSIHKTEAIVLKTFDFRETSLIAHFFTKEYGRLNGILKGIRKDPRKFASTLEPFSINEIIFYPSRASGLHLVSQCDLRDNLNSARARLESVASASYAVDLINRLMPAEEKNEEVYLLACFALRQINKGDDSEKVLRIFIIKLLKLIGFQPRLDGCVMCNKNILESAYFNIRRGGLLCPACAPQGANDSTGVLRGTIASITHMERNRGEDSLRLELTPQIKNELDGIIRNFMEFHLQINLKSRQLLEVLT